MGCDNSKTRPDEPASVNQNAPGDGRRPDELASENQNAAGDGRRPDEPASENQNAAGDGRRPDEPASENRSAAGDERRPDEPASETRSAAGDGRSAEVRETQPAHEPPFDEPQMTTQIHCVEDQTQQPPQVYCFEDRKQRPIQVYCVEDSVQSQEASREGAETSTSSKVVCGTLEEGQIAPELIDLIETLMESDAPYSLRTDIVCQSGQEGSGDSLQCDLYSTLMSEMEPPRVSKEQSKALPPPPVEALDPSKPQKEFKETHPDAPVAEVIGAQTTGLTAQQESLEDVRISDAATQTVPAGKGAEAKAGMSEEKQVPPKN